MNKYYKYKFYFSILLILFLSGCASFSLSQNKTETCNYELLFKNNDYIPSGMPCDGKISGYKHGWIDLKNRTQYHSGIDVVADRGTAIYATASGTVVYAGYNENNGLCIKISHHYGFETIYSHCSKLAVSAGKRIKKGQLIARVGATGVAIDNVLQYEIYVDGIQIDPEPYLSRSYNSICSPLHVFVLNRDYKKIRSYADDVKNQNYTDSFGLKPGKIAEIMNDKKCIELLKK